ncbi:uncharacterized protein LOC125202809 isoform X3 [Salvia hispanica]|uniref:uncharacterized protein LOC125202809 isoform X3 n=1 Tax=Salvia hispanica TaxID=49212 RepID=UPI0020095732|nr:uncharacterized protein LOC125202809 isoform X3 [Salvia hispanica]
MQRTITHQLNQSIRHELPNPSTSSLLLPRKMEPKDGYPPSFDYGESERRGREWHDDCATDEVLRILRGVINPPFGANLSTDDIAVRVKVMKARYLTFKKVTRTNGAYWNMKEKMVEADASTWKNDASAGACYYRDEPEFCFLASLFGLFDIKDNIPHEVITL